MVKTSCVSHFKDYRKRSIFKRNVEVKLKGNNKTSRKRKIEKETGIKNLPKDLASALEFDCLF